LAIFFQAKGAFHLLEVLKVLSENKFHVPVSISLDSPTAVSEASPKVRVRVSDLLGNSLGKMDVVVESAMRLSDGAVILANSKMADAGNGIYEIDMLAAKPGISFYGLKRRTGSD
jgi:oligosaccharyltransferase complex subunit delta (ribophorin II)